MELEWSWSWLLKSVMELEWSCRDSEWSWSGVGVTGFFPTPIQLRATERFKGKGDKKQSIHGSNSTNALREKEIENGKIESIQKINCEASKSNHFVTVRSV